MRFNIFVVILSVASALSLSTPFKRDVDTVKADIAAIQDQIKALEINVAALLNTGGTLAAVSLIRNTANDLDTLIQKTISDTQATPAFSQTDGGIILTSFESFVPTLSRVLVLLVEKKSAFDALGGVSALQILQEFKNLNADIPSLVDALIAKFYADQIARLLEFRTKITLNFATFINAII
ncbi:hypothetical protein PQX77_017857 [Marasmius sp. AFHP31]|nr:hypothetical protein PQX77_017857 [Marasmius sp. AFHP31]